MLKGDDLSAAYASADVFVMPSESETLGFVALEAMSSGLPVVAVAAGGLVDIMKNIVGEAGAPARPWHFERRFRQRMRVRTSWAGLVQVEETLTSASL